MDQGAFRQLLKTKSGLPGSSSQRPPTSHGQQKKTTILVSQPAFRPRNVKKAAESSYRDRASERRAGINEYEKIESLVHDFDKSTENIDDKEEVERKRQYLGGDKDHAILVKGLDFSLLEQNKAKMAASNALEEDDSLEIAFQQKSAEYVLPKKRTREDIIRGLMHKQTRTAVTVANALSDADPLEKAKLCGKFRPIGALDLNQDDKKEKQNPAHEKRKKKKRRVDAESTHTEINVPGMGGGPAMITKPATSISESSDLTFLKIKSKESSVVQVEAEELDDDFDIFAGVGEYKDLDLDDDEDDKEILPGQNNTISLTVPTMNHKWFEEDEIDSEVLTRPAPEPSAIDDKFSSPVDLQLQVDPNKDQLGKAVKLAPLASSSVPSIRDVLAMDAAAEAEAKRKARKEKKKAKKELTEAAKLDKDYKKLNSYMAKKG